MTRARFRLGWWLALLSLGAMPASGADLAVQVVTSGGAALPDAVVYAVPAVSLVHGTLASAKIDQIDKQFVPQVSVLRAGTAVYFPNSDNIRHSVYSFSPAKVFQLKLYAGRAAEPVLFDKPGVVVLGCNIHDRMVAWVLVVDTPYVAHTDVAGNARLDGLTPGDYTLRAWHAPLQSEQDGEALQVAGGQALAPHTLKLEVDLSDPAMAHSMPDMKP